mmetsp:Transcript_13382/g.35957  ORF Transcript_13382/g.35957 Transcript_13382/m.35957 type:complete len:91 (-) Transcript_13382:229-501(-)
MAASKVAPPRRLPPPEKAPVTAPGVVGTQKRPLQMSPQLPRRQSMPMVGALALNWVHAWAVPLSWLEGRLGAWLWLLSLPNMAPTRHSVT